MIGCQGNIVPPPERRGADVEGDEDREDADRHSPAVTVVDPMPFSRSRTQPSQPMILRRHRTRRWSRRPGSRVRARPGARWPPRAASRPRRACRHHWACPRTRQRRRASIPNRSQQRCSIVALFTPRALISTSPKSRACEVGRGHRVADHVADPSEQFVGCGRAALHQELDVVLGTGDLLCRPGEQRRVRTPGPRARRRTRARDRTGFPTRRRSSRPVQPAGCPTARSAISESRQIRSSSSPDARS